MQKLSIVLLLLAFNLLSCAQLPPATVPVKDNEYKVITHTRQAYESRRGRVECPALSNVLVSTLPELDVRGWCARNTETNSCVTVMQRFPGAPSNVLIIVREDVDSTVRNRLIVHEILHVLRSCDVVSARGTDAYLLRMRRGSDNIQYPSDPEHLDIELWNDIEGTAIRLVENPQ